MAGTSASPGSDGASTMPATLRLTAFSTRLTWSAITDSAAGPEKVSVALDLFDGRLGALVTFARRWSWWSDDDRDLAGGRQSATTAMETRARAWRRRACMRVRLSCSAAVAELVDPDGEQDHEANDDLLGEGRHAVHVQPVAQDADHEGADQRAETVPTPPLRDVPPMTAAAMASSSYITPSLGWAVTRRDISTQPVRPASARGDVMANITRG